MKTKRIYEVIGRMSGSYSTELKIKFVTAENKEQAKKLSGFDYVKAVHFREYVNKSKTKKISRSDFSFMPSGYGHYRVTYRSPVTFKEWTTMINNVYLIDLTKNAEEPKRKDLEELKRIVKN